MMARAAALTTMGHERSMVCDFLHSHLQVYQNRRSSGSDGPAAGHLMGLT